MSEMVFLNQKEQRQNNGWYDDDGWFKPLGWVTTFRHSSGKSSKLFLNLAESPMKIETLAGEAIASIENEKP